MKSLRKIIFWCHLSVGVIAGLLILFMAATGTLIAFEKQIVDFSEKGMRRVSAPPNTEPLSLETLIEKVKEAKPKAKLSGVAVQSDPALATTINLGRDGILFVNPYTGELLGEGAKNLRAFFKTTTELHRWLALQGKNRDIGKTVTGVGSICFFFLVLSGLFIWLPRGWARQQIKAVTVFKFGLKGHARNFNWHTTIGFWASSIILIVTLTGIIMSFDWASNLLYTVTQTERPERPKPSNNQAAKANNSDKPKLEGDANKAKPEPQQEVPVEVLNNLGTFYLEAKKQAPANWKTMNLRFPTDAKTPVRIFINEGNYWQNSQLSFEQKTAQLISYEPYTSLNLGRKLNSLAHPVHTGEVLGLVGQIVVFFAAIGTGFLIFTGFALAYRRAKS